MPNDKAWKLLNTLITILMSINIAITTYLVAEIGALNVEAHELDNRIIAIESNRFRQEDRADLLEHIMKIETSIASLPREVPPKWLLEMVKHNANRIERLEDIK